MKKGFISQLLATRIILTIHLYTARLLSYELAVTKTREKIIPEKSKYYERKSKVYIALYK